MRKKNLLIKATTAIIAASILLLAPLSVQASDGGYTYNYDWWGDVQESPDLYSVCRVFTSSELGLDVKLKNPQGLFVEGNFIYICDSGNNRIIKVERVSPEKLEVVDIIDSFKGAEPSTFSNPTDLAISEDGNIFIADQGNERILKLDKDLNYIMEFIKPTDNTLDPSLVFAPNKLTVDTAERVYCIASGINKGLVKYENDGTFSGFVGATPVKFDWTDYLWKKFASQEQRAKMESFVPTEYENIYMDQEGFIYATMPLKTDNDSRVADDENAVRKLNLMGNDILVHNGAWGVQGDLYKGSGGGYEGPSVFADVTVLDNDIYACLDQNRGRVFGYDDQGRLVFAFGGNGNMDGYFRRPSAIEHYGHELYVLDSIDCSITAFVPTQFGNLVYTAIEEFDKGHYEESGDAWQEVMNQNGNYDLAYIGIGRALLRQERYHESMKYFELKYDADNYSKAFKQYRKEWVEENIAIIVIVILALFLIPLGIGKFKALKYEIDTADIFNI
ncbi:NHL repeat-containing protein [Butyrivibrio sp. MC2021]|uniref:NHL repeat-containing protein n=1 Tax=Butyrivibrio sp. MC2021 TaxID=1408306 RepID=UPI0004796097|nr:NHL repeat-containing protein [Butyrivibrio sp. MC2021]